MRKAPRYVCTAVWFFMLLALAPSAQNSTGLTPDQIKRIEGLLSEVMSHQGFPGLSVAVMADYQLRWSRGFGMADMENPTPATPLTNYRLASISKPITATAVLQLAERGRLDLDAPIQNYCSVYPEQPWPITARQLLGHLGGIVETLPSPPPGYTTRHYTSITEALEHLRGVPLAHEPGTRYLYSGWGYDLLGCIVEGASGLDYLGYVRSNIFKPAGMARARTSDVYDIIPYRARSYRRLSSGELTNAGLNDPSLHIPSAGLSATVEDLAYFAVALQTGTLLEPETLERMFTRQRTLDGQEVNYGLGWSITQRKGQKVVWHTGAGSNSGVLYMVPEKRIAVILIANLSPFARPVALAGRIGDIVLGEESEDE